MITGILLAAGASVRFGSKKLLHSLPEGEPIGLASARRLASGVDRAIAVIPPQEPALATLFDDAGLEVIICTRCSEGMGTSLACGIAASKNAAGWVIALADMPFIEASTIHVVAQALRSGALLAAPWCDGRRGHPVGFSRPLGEQLVALSGDVGAKEIVARHRESLVLLPVSDPGIHRDIDTAADLPR